MFSAIGKHNLPMVSVIVPIYNVENYIHQCAVSLFSQSYDNIQFVFVDDGSMDHSIDILEDVLLFYPERIPHTAIVRQPNRGLPKARMTGLAMACGEYVTHVDSDDWVEPDYIRLLVERAVEENADVVYCDYYKEYCDRRPEIENEGNFKPSDGPGAVKAIHSGVIRAYMWNKLVKRELYNLDAMVVPVNGYHEDIVFQTQILFPAAKCVHLMVPLYHYRRRRTGALTKAPVIYTRRQSAENMLELYKALPKDRGPLTVCGTDILRRGGWYCCIILAFKMLMRYPDAVRILSCLKYDRNNRVPISKQVYTKLCCKILTTLNKTNR